MINIFLLSQLISIDKMSLYANIPLLVCLLRHHFIFQMSSIVSEQWIHIRHLEQALELTKVCSAGMGTMIENFIVELLN